MNSITLSAEGTQLWEDTGTEGAMFRKLLRDRLTEHAKDGAHLEIFSSDEKLLDAWDVERV